MEQDRTLRILVKFRLMAWPNLGERRGLVTEGVGSGADANRIPHGRPGTGLGPVRRTAVDSAVVSLLPPG